MNAPASAHMSQTGGLPHGITGVRRAGVRRLDHCHRAQQTSVQVRQNKNVPPRRLAEGLPQTEQRETTKKKKNAVVVYGGRQRWRGVSRVR